MNKWIYIFCCCIFSICLLNSCLEEPNDQTGIINAGSPVLGNDSIGAISSNSAEVFAVILKQNGGRVENCGFYLVKEGSKDTVNIPVTISQSSNAPISFNATINNLEPNTKYNVISYASNKIGVSINKKLALTTLDGTPVIGKLNILEYSFTEASYSSSILSQGGNNIIRKGICWAVYPKIPTIGDSTYIDNSTEFSGEITGLTAGVHYNVKAFAVNSFGISYSDMSDFVTANDFSIVELESIFAILDGGALAKFRIHSSGNGQITSAGLCWAIHPEPTLSDYFNKVEASAVGPYSGAITQLRGNNKYYVRAFAQNSMGLTAYSDTISIVTPAIFMPVSPFPGSTRLPNSVSLFTYERIAYMLGGDKGSEFTNELWAYNAADRWDAMASFPDVARKGQTSVLVGSMAYVFGGVDNTDQSTNKLYRYFLKDNKWENISISGTWPNPVHSSAGAALYYGAYFIGGNHNGAVSNEVWYLNTAYSKWERKNDFPVKQQKGIAINLFSTIYAGLGQTDAYGLSFDRRLWALPYYEDTWTLETTLPDEAGEIRSAVAFNDALFMIDNTGTIWKYDIKNKSWKQKSQLPSSNVGDYQHCIFVIDYNIYIGLGISYKSLIKYDPSWDN